MCDALREDEDPNSLGSRDRHIWVDWEDAAVTPDWIRRTQEGIENADVFLFVLSPDSVKSETCEWQLEHALKNGKRIVPVVSREVDYREVRKEIQSLNW